MSLRRIFGIYALLVIFFILLALMADNGWCTNYYVDSADGNNDNAGTTADVPWKTIAKVNAASFSPGDSVLFKRGSTWREQLTVPSSGSVAGGNLVFSCYGTGAYPIISGLDSIPNTDFAQIAGQIYAITGDYTTMSMLYRDGAYGNFVDEIAAENDFIITVAGDSVYTQLPAAGVPADYLWEYDVRTQGIYCTLKRCITLNRLNTDGFRKDSESTAININKTNGLVVDSVFVSDVFYEKNPTVGGTAWHVKKGIGLFMNDCDSFVVKNSSFRDMTTRGVDILAATTGYPITVGEIYGNVFTNLRSAIEISSIKDLPTITGVDIHHNKILGFGAYYYEPTNWTKGFLSVSNGSTSVIKITNLLVRNNYLSGDSTGVWILIGNLASGCRIYNNIMITSLKTSLGISFDSSFNHAGNHTVYNNTLYYGYNYINRSSGNTFKNNIFYNTTNRVVLVQDAVGATNLTLNYNVYDTDQANKAYIYGLNELTFAGLQTNGYETNGINDDVSFSNTPSSSYVDTLASLALDSPALNAGTDVGLTSDYSGNTLWGYPDIGALEFQQGVNISLPVGGESFTAEIDTTIAWSSLNSDSLIVYYSADAGGNWTEIARVASADTTYAWTVPSGATTQGLIKLTDTANSVFYDVVRSVFSILSVGRKGWDVTNDTWDQAPWDTNSWNY